MKNILLGVAVLAVLAVASFTATRAFFSDTETSAGNVFAAGSLDLLVGIDAPESAWPEVAPRNNNNQQLFAIGGLIPGHMGTGQFRLESTADAWACMAADITANPENTRLPQEKTAGDTSAGGNSGELKNYMQIAIWEANGLSNADGVVGPNEADTLQIMSLEDFANGDYYALQDSSANGGDNPLEAGDEYRHEFAYCFGEFSNVSTVQASGGTLECDGTTASNVAQTDGVEVLMHFYAEQMQNNENFECSSLNAPTVPVVSVGASLASYPAPSCTTTVSSTSSIQSAVNTATSGQTVCVDGTYDGSGDNAAIHIENPGVTLAATTRGVDLFHPVVLSASNVTVTGFDGVVGQAATPAEQAAFYVEADGDLFEISFNTVSGGTGVGILTESGGSLGGGLIANNVIDGVSAAGIYTNPHTGVFVIEFNDIDNNAAGIGGLMGATVRYNEFEHTVASAEAIGIDSTFDSNPATANFNNFLNGVQLNDYGATIVMDAENNFFNLGAASQTDTGEFDADPEAGAVYAHN